MQCFKFKKMENLKEDEMNNQFILDYIALAKKEAENRKVYEEYMRMMDDHMKKTIRIKITPYLSEEWFIDQGWVLNTYNYINTKPNKFYWVKRNLRTPYIFNNPAVDVVTPIITIEDDRYKTSNNQVFEGILSTEEEFKLVEKILSK